MFPVSDGCLLMFRFCRLRLRDVDTPPVVDLISVSLLYPCVCVLYRIPTLLFLHVLFLDQMCARTIRSSQIDKPEPVVVTKHHLVSTAPTRSCPKIIMPASWKIVPGAVGYAKVGSCMTRGSTSTRIHLSCTPPPPSPPPPSYPH